MKMYFKTREAARSFAKVSGKKVEDRGVLYPKNRWAVSLK